LQKRFQSNLFSNFIEFDAIKIQMNIEQKKAYLFFVFLKNKRCMKYMKNQRKKRTGKKNRKKEKLGINFPAYSSFA
jgi:hypothetical protein